MRIPEYVAIAQWVLLLTLGVLVTLMFRQLGRHLGVARSSPDLGPAVGTPAAGFEYARLDPPAREFFDRPAAGRRCWFSPTPRARPARNSSRP